MQSLSRDVESVILTFLTPTEFLHWSGVNRHARQMRDRHPDSYHHVAISTSQLMHQVFDRRANVLMHGPGGCGKTYALTTLHTRALALGRRIAMTGTTGVSSCGLPDGMTLHSFSGLGKATIRLDKLRQETESHRGRYLTKFRQFRTIDILVIDEVSMLGTRFFGLLDFVARFARESALPFGGLQIVLSGDFLQLPPVGDKFVFTTPEYQALNVQPIVFANSYRQKGDSAFFHMLKRLRIGVPNPRDLQLLESRRIDQVPHFILDRVGVELVPPFMYSRHVQVEKLNQDRMAMLTGTGFTYVAEDSYWIINSVYDPETRRTVTRKVPYTGPPPVIPPALLSRIEIRQPRELIWKPMAQYILTQNFRTRHRLVNGSVCLALPVERGQPKMMQFRNGRAYPMNEFRCSNTYRVSPQGNIYLRREQLALRVGYAVTIHSALGMTLDQAVVDAGSSVFASAQTYVACSRVRRLADLYLLDFKRTSLRVNEQARAYVAQIEHHPELVPPTPPAAKPVAKRRSVKRKATTPTSNKKLSNLVVAQESPLEVQ